MAKQIINVGSAANDGTGSTIRAGGSIINDNFNEIYNTIGNGTTITLTATPTELNLLTGATAIVTNTNSVSLSNKTISGSSNTISNIGNTSLTNSNIILVDDTSSTTTISLGESLKISGGTGLTSTISGDDLTINLDNTAVTPNTYGSTTAIPVITIDQQGRITSASTSSISSNLTIVDDSSTVSTITIGTDTLSILGGSGITSTISGDTISLSLDNTISSENFINKVLQTSASIDVINSGSGAYQFNSHYSGDNPTLYLRAGHTYAFNLAVTGHPFHLQTVPGSYSAGNPYTTGLTHISTTGVVTTGASALLQVTGTLYYEVPSAANTSIFYACQLHGSMQGKIVVGNITENATGDGSTTGFTINSGRTVDDVLVFVSGLLRIPTTDYTISGTTLTFISAPSAAAAIVIKYLG